MESGLPKRLDHLGEVSSYSFLLYFWNLERDLRLCANLSLESKKTIAE